MAKHWYVITRCQEDWDSEPVVTDTRGPFSSDDDAQSWADEQPRDHENGALSYEVVDEDYS